MITRITTFIKTKFKISNNQTNIDKYRLAANISTVSDLESPSNFQVKEKQLLKSVQKQRNYALIKNNQEF